MDMEWLRRLIGLVEDSEIDSLEISRFTTRVKISKSPPVAPAAGSSLPGPRAGAVPGSNDGSAPPERANTSGTAAEAGEEVEVESLHEILSPMVGTFYRAPAPDAPPYVEVGDRVREGQTLCILEAMKLMNELESEVDGVIREIAVQNAEPVEYGQPLFRIEPD